LWPNAATIKHLANLLLHGVPNGVPIEIPGVRIVPLVGEPNEYQKVIPRRPVDLPRQDAQALGGVMRIDLPGGQLMKELIRD
jgi:hypothetical protein